MDVAGFYSPVVVDLAGLKASRDKIPILRDHDPSRVVGQTDSIAIDSSGVRLTGIITGEDGDSSSIVTHARNGLEWQASIGANIVRHEFLKAGEKAVVNGREVSGPLLIAREARLFETSFVAVGADQQTSASVAASNPSSGSPSKGDTAMNFDQWLAANGFDPAAITDTQKAFLKAAYAEHAPPPAPPPTPAKTVTAAPGAASLDQVIANHRAENDRTAAITRMSDEAISERPALLEEISALARTAIEAKSTLQDFELALLKLMRRVQAAGPYVHASRPLDNKELPTVVEAAVCKAGGLRDLERHYEAKTLTAADKHFRRGLGLVDLFLLAARENGYQSSSTRNTEEIFAAAFGRGGGTIRADGFSTFSLTGTLGNVANKFLAAGFLAVESGWRDIYKPRNVKDFKAITSYSLSSSLVYEKLGPGGEIKHGTLSETSYTNQADTYGKMLGITRKDIINDDLGALTSVPTHLGRAGALAINEVFWTAFLATRDTFWSSGNANLSSGGGSALSSAGLQAALLKFRKQTGPDSKPLGISPAILLVPPELEITADELMTSMIVNTGGSSSTDKVPNRNVWGAKFRRVTSSYLSNSSITNYATAHWFLLADPMDLPTIEVAFLNGQEMPFVETASADFDTLGVRMRAYHDFGVALQEYRASVRSAGS